MENSPADRVILWFMAMFSPLEALAALPFAAWGLWLTSRRAVAQIAGGLALALLAVSFLVVFNARFFLDIAWVALGVIGTCWFVAFCALLYGTLSGSARNKARRNG